MKYLEEKIINLIENNSHLSEDLKKRYILALFLMEEKEQIKYLKLFEAFNYRCNSVSRGIFVLKEEEKEKIMKTFEEVKEDILSKIHSNN